MYSTLYTHFVYLARLYLLYYNMHSVVGDGITIHHLQGFAVATSAAVRAYGSNNGKALWRPSRRRAASRRVKARPSGGKRRIRRWWCRGDDDDDIHRADRSTPGQLLPPLSPSRYWLLRIAAATARRVRARSLYVLYYNIIVAYYIIYV